MPASLKIYIDKRPVYLVEGRPKDAEAAWRRKHPTVYYRRFGDVKRAMWLMENNTTFRSLTIYGSNLNRVKKKVSELFRTIDAAGGLVTNPKGKVLMIERRGRWDLPKGKVDPGETPKQAALREVEEETGITDLVLGKPIVVTYHIYTDRKGRVLKRTYWYRMTTARKQKGSPEAEEGITQVKWVKGKLSERLQNTYGNILEVFREAGMLPASMQ